MIIVHDENLKITSIVFVYAEDYPAQLDAAGERWLRLPPRAILPDTCVEKIDGRRMAFLDWVQVEPLAVSAIE